MSFFSKSKKSSTLDTFKTFGMITSALLALNKALKENFPAREELFQKQQPKQNRTGTIVAGFVGGIVAGAITALLLAPESGEDLRHRVTHAFEGGNGHDEDAILAEAREKAEALAARAKAQAADAEKDLNSN